MTKKFLVTIGGACLLVALVLVSGVMSVSGQGGDPFEPVPIITSATDSVGIGSYVAAEAYAVAAGEDPEAQPVQAYIFPYGIYPAMQVTAIEDFVQPDPAVEGFTFEWSLTAPEGSAADVMQGTVGIFMADVEGQYDLTLTATDADGNAGTATWTVFATSYVGVGGFTGRPEFPECGTCHTEKGFAWYGTAHATYFIRGIDGQVEGFGPEAISRATTGFDNSAGAVNGGFDDVAAEAGWTWPESLAEGNWSAMTGEFPQVADMANIQCEACHGPGAMHPTSVAESPHPKISSGMDYGTCAQCHAVDETHSIPQQWENSAHADKNAQAFWYPIGEDRTSCVSCHSGLGFIDAASGVPTDQLRTDYQIITCAVCHDPHDATSPNQLRVFDSVVLPDGTEVANAGPAATCMSCHNARRDAVSTVEGAAEGGDFSTPHYSTAAELMNGTGAYSWGETLPSTMHGMMIQGTCVTCHMADTPGMDDMGTADDPADDQPLPGHNAVGGHSFAMTSPDGVQNLAVCAGCHGPQESFEFVSLFDYDGDGDAETNDAEVAGLRELLEAAVVEKGVVVLDSHPYYEIPEDATVDVYGAVWNLKFFEDPASPVHNLKYTVSALQLSYEKLTGSPVPDAELLY